MGNRFREEPAHGTRSGYDWHRRDMKELPCEECRIAERDYWRNERVIRKETINGNAKKRRMVSPQANRNNRKRAIRLGLDWEWYSPTQVLEIHGTDCHICKEPIDLDAPRQTGKLGWERGLQIDHIIPLSKGGPDILENVKPSHGYCNNVKNATIMPDEEEVPFGLDKGAGEINLKNILDI
jgi:5-methylcytosine-specific restriction endonuclease McrA